MPTGSGKSSLCKYLKRIVDNTQAALKVTDRCWFCDDQSMEKMGALMHDNNGKLLGLYDELALFLSQMNVFRNKG
jgi:ABC-type antimicrobial peptide transport system ATPase subunit